MAHNSTANNFGFMLAARKSGRNPPPMPLTSLEFEFPAGGGMMRENGCRRNISGGRSGGF
jgi:hypothetical protein